MTTDTELVTLTDVLRQLNIPDHAVDKSTVGRRLARMWREATGLPTSMPYGPKADGSGGYHTLAAYPISFLPTIKSVLQEALTTPRSEQEHKAPRPRKVEESVSAQRGTMQDATPTKGSSFWWDT